MESRFVFYKMVKATLRVVAVLAFSSVLTLRAHDPKDHPTHHNPSQAITITGEVIEPGCFLIHGARGPEHKACAEMCAKGGTTLTILDEKTNTLYIPVAPEHGKNPNDPLLPYAGARVTVVGVGLVKNGYHGIVIKSVSPAGEKNPEAKK